MQKLLASDLFALAHSQENKGDQQCHWCSAKCIRGKYLHDDEPPALFTKTRSTAKCPANPYICSGCWLYRRKRVSLITLEGSILDRQDISKYSWVVTNQVRIITDWDHHSLYSILLKPPLKFCLSLITEGENLLQLAVANNLESIQANTQLHFTYNNVLSSYTVYELEEALKYGTDGKQPGVRFLVNLLGAYTPSLEEKEKEDIENSKKLTRGRPKSNKEDMSPRKMLRKIS